MGTIHKAGTTNVVPYDEKKIPSYYKADVIDVPNDEFKYLIGRDIPNGHLVFHKKKRIVANYYTTVDQLRYARGWSGRFFAWCIRVAIAFLRKFNPKAANMIVMGVYYIPLRNLSRMTGGAIHWYQLDGLILMFNGHFFKGLHKFLKEGRAIKKERKLIKKYLKNKE